MTSDRLDVGANRAGSIASLATDIAKTGREIEELANSIRKNSSLLAEKRSYYDAAIKDLAEWTELLVAEQPPIDEPETTNADHA